MKLSIALLCVPAALAKVTTMGFKELESSTTQKVVVFHEPGNDASDAAVATLKKLDEEGGYSGTYEWK
jgi:hypothetical protein